IAIKSAERTFPKRRAEQSGRTAGTKILGRGESELNAFGKRRRVILLCLLRRALRQLEMPICPSNLFFGGGAEHRDHLVRAQAFGAKEKLQQRKVDLARANMSVGFRAGRSDKKEPTAGENQKIVRRDVAHLALANRLQTIAIVQPARLGALENRIEIEEENAIALKPRKVEQTIHAMMRSPGNTPHNVLPEQRNATTTPIRPVPFTTNDVHLLPRQPAESLLRPWCAVFASNLTGTLKIRIAHNRNACRFRALDGNAGSRGEDDDGAFRGRADA